MAILIVSPNRDPSAWIEALKKYRPDLEVEVFPEVTDPEKIEFVLSWKHPHGMFRDYPNLKVIASMGAGIDHITSDPTIPDHVAVTRVIDDQLTKDMSIFVLALVLEQLRNLSFHHASSGWEPKPYSRPEEVQVGIMGMGVLGVGAAQQLLSNGFRVAGWSKSQKDIPGVTSYHGPDQLRDFLSASNILVCLLPLTAETENILNTETFSKLPKGAYLINVARGRHLVEQDLLEALDTGQLSGASLDVFRQEPLPEDHPFQDHKKIKLTPHVASVTHPSSVAPQILENYQRMRNNQPLNHLVSRQKKY